MNTANVLNHAMNINSLNIQRKEFFSKVLLIEDNLGDARLVELLLGESDYIDCEITHALSLKEGLEAMKSSEYDVVLLDLSLTDSMGFDTLLTFMNSYPSANVIVLTGFSDKSMGVKAVKAGAQDFLVKGAFDADNLAKALRYSVERYQTLKRLEIAQRTAHIGNWECKPQTNEVILSDETYRILGYPPRSNEVNLENIKNPSSHLFVFSKVLEEIIENGFFKDDLVFLNKAGEKRYVHIDGTLTQNTQKQVVSIHGIVQDITERKQVEEENSRNKRRYETIFSQSTDAIFVENLEGKVFEYNQATLHLLGLTDEAIKVANTRDFYVDINDREKLIAKLKQEGTVRDFEVALKREDGEIRQCLISTTSINTDDFDGFNSIIKDITERIRAEEIKKSESIAAETNKMREEFMARISHEMRTPMNAILGMSGLLLDDKETTESQKSYISAIQSSSQGLLVIINDILDMSKLESGKFDFKNNNFHLHDTLAGLFNIVQYQLKEKDIAFELSIDETIPQNLIGDNTRLNQILINLVGNAFKFTESGSVIVNVTTVGKNDHNIRLKFEVIDTGIGIPKDKQQAVFDKFVRVTYKSKLYEGTGLGLSIVQQLVTQQGGIVGLESEEEKGSNFYFELPFEINKGMPASNIPSAAEDYLSQFDTSKKYKVLLVEDNKLNQVVAKKTIQNKFKNVTTTIANDGKIAVELLKDQNYDLILMDLQMPNMSGSEASLYIRENLPQHHHVPIIAMTAEKQIAFDDKYKTFKMDDFISKPFDREQLFQKLALYLTHGR